MPDSIRAGGHGAFRIYRMKATNNFFEFITGQLRMYAGKEE
jgi:hypothetical protein